MFVLRRFLGDRYERLNAIVDELGGHLSSYVNLVGSATLPFPEVCAMQALPATACRVEGHLGDRLFPATDPIDLAEELIEEEVRRLFSLGNEYAVSSQPHSATLANHAVYQAVLGDSHRPVAALDAAAGGHVSHRLGVRGDNEFLPFPLEGQLIDYDGLGRIVKQRRPALLAAGGTSYTREIDYQRLREVADLVGAHLHADLAHTAPFVIAGTHGPVLPYCDSITVDPGKNLRGPRGGILLYRRSIEAKVRRAIFPVLQTSPNQTGLLAMAACLSMWSSEAIHAYAERLVRSARELSGHLEPSLGGPVYGGTDTHLILVDLRSIGLGGREAENRLESARILANRNQVPGDAKPPWAPSGLRLGTTVPAILHYANEDVRSLADVIGAVLRGKKVPVEIMERLLSTYHRPVVSTASEPTSSTTTGPTRLSPVGREMRSRAMPDSHPPRGRRDPRL